MSDRSPDQGGRLPPHRRVVKLVIVKSRRWAIVLAAVFLSAAGPGMLADSADLEARRQRVSSLSAAERERLERNFREYLALPPERKAAVVELHEAVTTDTGLQQTLQNYAAWLDTLSPWQRQQLAQESDPDKKITLVRNLLDEQRRRRDEYEREQQRLEEIWQQTMRDRDSSRFIGRGPSRYTSSMLHVVGQVLQENLPEGTLPEKLPSGAAQPIAVVYAALEHFSQRENFQEEPIPREIFRDIAKQVPYDQDRAYLEKTLHSESGSRSLTRWLLSKCFWAWWGETRRDMPRPDNLQELHKLTQKLGSEERRQFEALEKQSPAEAYKKFHEALWRLFYEQRVAELHREAGDLRKWREKLNLDNHHNHFNNDRTPRESDRSPSDPQP